MLNTQAAIATTVAGLGLIICAGKFALVRDARIRRLAQRISERVAPLAPARPPKQHLLNHPWTVAALAFLQRWASRLSGYRLDRTLAYPTRVGIVVLVLLMPTLIIAYMGSMLAGVSLIPAIPFIWIGFSQLTFRVFHTRYADKLYRQFPDVLSMIVRSVRAGIPLHEGLRIVSNEAIEPSATQFKRVMDQVAIGIPVEEALQDAAERTGVPEYGFFTVALGLQGQTGGSLAETLDNLADVIRKRVALRLRAIALASEARTSAYILGALPVVTGVLLSVINLDYIRPLFTTKSGNHLLLAAVSLLGFAGLVMRILIQRSLR